MHKKLPDIKILAGLWRYVWPAALLLYLSYFFYRWIGVYVSGILGNIAESVLNGSELERMFLLKLALAFLCALVLMPGIDLLTNVLLFRKGLQYEAKVTETVFSKDAEQIGMLQSNEWMARIFDDPLEWRQMALVTPMRILADGTVFVIAWIQLISLDVILALLFLAGGIAAFAIQRLFEKMSIRIQEGDRAYEDRKTMYQMEMLQSHQLWVKQRLAGMWESKMSLFFHAFLKKQRKRWMAAAGIDAAQRAAVFGALLGAMAYAIVRIQEGSLTAGTFVTVYFLVIQVRTMAESIFKSAQEMRGYRAQEDRMRFLLEKKEQKGTSPIPDWKCLWGRQLSYRYIGQEAGTAPVDIMLKRGELIHLKGENGSGKTTLLRMLCGLFPSKNGEVYLDEKRLEELDTTVWRSKIAYMQQFPDIFMGSVKENVRIGNLRLTEEKLDRILERTGLAELADRELCGMSGELSGGEMKRIEAARMLARMEQAELLIFDEPFEQLDSSGRILIEDWLKDEKKSRILVTHGAEG